MLSSPTVFSLLIATGAATSVGLFWWAYLLNKKTFLKSLDQKLLLIKLPSQRSGENDKTAPDFKEEINDSAQLFALLSSFKKPFTFEAAVPHIGEEIHFFLSVASEAVEAVKRQIHAVWPDADIAITADFNIFHHTGESRAVFLKQQYSYVLPIRTYAEVGDDTFAPIISGLSKINDIGEGAAIQVVVKPINNKKVKKTIASRISSLKSGADPDQVFSGSKTISLKDFHDALASKNNSKTEAEMANQASVDEEWIKVVQEKATKPLLEVNIRVVGSAPTALQADSIVDGIVAGFAQLESPKRNQIKIIKPKGRRLKDLLYSFTFRRFNDAESMILNTDELASLFHLPTSSTKTPHIKWLNAREGEPPSVLPTAGVMIGETNFRGDKRPVFLADDDRRRHLYIIGQTGTGKTTLMKNMILSDIRNGQGAAVIDPHGELVNDIAGLIPDNRLDDVIIFDPADFERPAGLNMLDYNRARPEEKTFVVNEMQSIFNRLFSQDTMGPMFEQYMRNTLLLLMEAAADEPATLIEVPRVLTDEAYRHAKLSRINNPSVIDFWSKEAEKAGGEAALSNIAPYITSKFNNFIANDYVRPIIGQAKSSFSFREIMDNGKILLVNLSKGKIGDINAGLLGMIVTGKLLMAALSRTDIIEQNRRDFYLYIDEFQNFTTDSISTILSEARKYRLNLTIAHQFIAQLSDQIRDSVFGNVGSMVAMRIGAADAKTLEDQFRPVFTQNDLMNIENLNAYAKILINGHPAKPFNIKIPFSDYGEADRTAVVRNLSRQKYGQPRAQVEQDIFSRLRS